MLKRQGRVRVMLGGATGCIFVASLSYAHGCGNESAAETADSGADASGFDARSRSETSRDEPDVWTPPGIVPNGWKLYTDYNPSCGFYVPEASSHLPSPLQWESCSTRIGTTGGPDPQGMACRRMVTDWEPEPGGQHLTAWFSAAKSENGKQVIQFIRMVGERSSYSITADADGLILNALLGQGECAAWHPTVGPTRVLNPIHDRTTGQDFKSGGVLGAAYGELWPKVHLPYGHRPSEVFEAAYVTGRDVFMQNSGPGSVYSFDTGKQLASITTAPGDEGLAYVWYTFHGNDAFFVGASSQRSILKVWTAEGGVKTLLAERPDSGRVLYGIAVDGTDMVWGESADRPDPSQPFTLNETWTAKYTTNPADAARTKRRVRSEYVEQSQYVVGCGYAANQINPPSTWGKGGVRVTRLSDGRSWEIVDRSEAQLVNWRIRRPIAVTCDELFAVAVSGAHFEVVRVRLDSLGPGIPAD